MNGWIIVLIILPLFLAVIILIVFRIYYRTHSKEKIPSDPLDNAAEIKRKESFRQMLKNFLQRY